MIHHSRFLNQHPALVLCVIGFFAFGPLIFSTGIGSIASLTDTCVHLIRFCLATLERFDFFLHGLPLALIGTGITAATLRRFRSVRLGVRIILRIPTRAPSPSELVGRLAERYELQDKVRVTVGPSLAPAFTAGLIRPRIYISQGLEHVLSEPELEAVFLHERHHLRSHDPLRGVVARFVADALFWIPMMSNVLADVLARMEFAADDAARAAGDVVLASAIIKVAELRTVDIAAAATFVTPTLVEQRVERLLDGDAATTIEATRPRSVALSIAVLAILWSLGVASSAAHASHVPDSSGHCPHHHELGVLHAPAGRSGHPNH